MAGQAVGQVAGDGSGYGYGYVSGSGYGSGSYGSGYGSGSCSCSYGSGSGSGSYGSGSGYGSGYGYGDGLQSMYESHSLIAGQQVVIAFWRSDAKGQSANGGGIGEAARPGLMQEVKGPLRICTDHALHGSLAPGEWRGERWWIVALHEPVQREGNKIASLKRTILEELT